MFAFTLLSFLILAGFILLNCLLHNGIPGSYSAFSAFWQTEPRYSRINAWSAVTAAAAILMIPPMVEVGDGNAFQFLGFFAPLYLIVVSLTPEWDIDKRQRRVHVIGAALCAFLALLWLVVIRDQWWLVCSCFAAAVIAGSWSKTLPGSAVFWGEMVMFLSVYLSLLIG